MTNYLPESRYSIDSALTRQNLKKGDIVTGKVEIIMKAKQFLIVDLGTVKAHMTFEDCSIYKAQSHKGYIDPNIYSLLGKVIRAKIVEIGDTIMLSRKDLMKEALDYFKAVNPKEFTVAITAFNEFLAFVDVGAGIHGRIIPSEFSKSYFMNIQDIGLKVEDFFKAKNLGYNEELKSFDLSRVAMISSEPHNLQREDYANFKVFKALDDGVGYLGLVDKKYPALLDSINVKLHYGDEVIGIVKEITSKGIKLKFEAFTYNE